MDNVTLTEEDVAHCLKVWEELIEADIIGEYDGPEIVMTSIGYAEVWLDGEVVAYGGVVVDLNDY